MATETRDKMDVGQRWEYVEPDNWYGLSSLVRNEHGEPIAQIPLSGWGKRKGRKIGAMIAATPDLIRTVRALLEYLADDAPAAERAREVLARATKATP